METKYRKVFKWTLSIITGLIFILLVAYAIIAFMFTKHLDREYNFETTNLIIPTDSASIARGEHIVQTRGCNDCHSKNLEGKVFVDDPALGRIVATNLTKGKGGIGTTFTDQDWVKAIRHGVKPNNKALVIMPSEEYHSLSNRDLADLIAYLKAVPPVDNQLPEHEFKPLLRTLYVMGKFSMLTNADKIDHSQKPLEEKQAVVSKDYGKYLAVGCKGCHGENFKGKEMPIPGMKPSVDITSTGSVGKWTDEEFIATLKTGKTPDGRQLDNKDMPWQMTKNYTKDELKSIYLFLNKLP